jgi:hypothetical protein
MTPDPTPTTPPTLREALEICRVVTAGTPVSSCIDRENLQDAYDAATQALAQPDPAEEIGKWKEAEAETSAAYLRLRSKLNAFDTNHGGENRFQVTEAALDSVLVEIATLKDENSRLQSLLDIEQRNAPFYKELADDYEKALGPDVNHPKGGCWVLRTEAIRQERDRLRVEVADMEKAENFRWQTAVSEIRGIREDNERLRAEVGELQSAFNGLNGEREDFIRYCIQIMPDHFAVGPIQLARQIISELVGSLVKISEFDQYEPAGPATNLAKSVLSKHRATESPASGS